jgi:NAD(P)H-dependent FMN reductase/GNAT superfamily N-acetyltransferase
MSLTCAPVAGVAAEALLPVLHDAEEDDERIRAALRDPACQAYAATVAGHLVGAAVVRWRQSEPSEIVYLAVAAAERGKGYGQRIVAALQAELPTYGRTLLVGTANSALDNIAFYQKCGFRMSAVKRDFFDYIRPPVREHGIEMRDMIVFSYEIDDVSGIRVLLVSGSTRAASTNTAALRTVRMLAPGGVTAVLFDGLADLPPFIPDDDTAPMPVEWLRRQLAAADVVLFCTPEYAGALPGSFKNLIDWTVGSGELYRKPVAWINVAAGGRGGGAMAELRRVLGYVDAAVIEPACVRVPVPRDAVGPDGTVVDDAIRAGLTDVLHTITKYCTEHRNAAVR